MKSIGVATAASATGTSNAVAADDTSDVEIENIPLKNEKLTQYKREIEKSVEFKQLSKQVKEVIGHGKQVTSVGGYTTFDSEKVEIYDSVYFEYDTSKNLTAHVIWVKKESDQHIFARLYGTVAHLSKTAAILDAQSDVSGVEKPQDQVLIERFIEPDSDTAIVTALLDDVRTGTQEFPEKSQIPTEKQDHLGIINLDDETVTTLSSSDFVDCVTDGAGGIVTGGGACAVTCRDGCFNRPNYLGCLVCAGCAAVVACYLGKCADEHLSSTFCNAALADCAIPGVGAGGCGVAYGCVVGNCSII